jgi:hypothetical protein
MAFSVQDDGGTIDGANAYITVDEFKTYHRDRGNSWSGGSGAIQDAIVVATDYLDTRFQFVGDRKSVSQRTQWPRVDAIDRDGNARSGVPVEVEEACAEYALIALSSTLNPTPTRDDTGQPVEMSRKKVGPLEKEIRYGGGGAVFQLPKYPIADQKLRAAGLVVSGRDIVRG